jgi:hypothetical protein
MTDLPADLAGFIEPCPDCNQPILWPQTVNNVRMPVDAEPVGNGNVMVVRVDSHPLRLICNVVRRSDISKLAAGGHLLYRHHRITCTRAEKWARPQRPAPAVSTAGDPGVEGLF